MTVKSARRDPTHAACLTGDKGTSGLSSSGAAERCSCRRRRRGCNSDAYEERVGGAATVSYGVIDLLMRSAGRRGETSEQHASANMYPRPRRKTECLRSQSRVAVWFQLIQKNSLAFCVRKLPNSPPGLAPFWPSGHPLTLLWAVSVFCLSFLFLGVTPSFSSFT